MKALLALSVLILCSCDTPPIQDIIDNANFKGGLSHKEGALKDRMLTRYQMEYAYFEGQKDAMEHDIRIMWSDGKPIWIKSPWDGKDVNSVLFDPRDTTVADFREGFVKLMKNRYDISINSKGW